MPPCMKLEILNMRTENMLQVLGSRVEGNVVRARRDKRRRWILQGKYPKNKAKSVETEGKCEAATQDHPHTVRPGMSRLDDQRE